jgi:hypothetical protein
MTHFNVQVAVVKPGWIGVPWKTVRTYKNRAVANQVARNMERDGETTRVLQSDGAYITREQVKDIT